MKHDQATDETSGREECILQTDPVLKSCAMLGSSPRSTSSVIRLCGVPSNPTTTSFCFSSALTGLHPSGIETRTTVLGTRGRWTR